MQTRDNEGIAMAEGDPQKLILTNIKGFLFYMESRVDQNEMDLLYVYPHKIADQLP